MWRRTKVLIGVASAVMTLLCVTAVTVHAQQDPGARAVAEIDAAQRRANDAAAAWAFAAERLEELEHELERSEAALAALELRLSEVRGELEQVVLQRFMSANVSTLPFLSGFQRPTDQAQAAVLLGIVTEATVVDLDDLEVLVIDVAASQRRADRDRVATERARRVYADAVVVAQDEVRRLQEAETLRQNDVAVQRARTLQRASQARAEANETNVADRTSRRNSTVQFGRPGWVCPVSGPTAFADTWGAPRPGDRRHLGVDFISPRGTPLVAVVPGVATSGQNSLGGNVVYLAGDDGHRYYYAHLDRWGRLGRVAAGDVIGYMGDTGNAVGVPHLHFEIRPGGGPNVNPYPTVRAYC